MSPTMAGLALVGLGFAVGVLGVASMPSPWAVPCAVVLTGAGILGAGLIAIRGAR